MNVRPCQTTEHKPCSTYKDFLRHSPATPISQVSVTLPYSVQSAPGRSWYLAHFTTYHNTKHTIRVVFDSSCEFSGVSLNKVLLPGPDLMNNLLGVLMRFRKENVAVMCNVEQMFHSFHVNPAHRDFLHFLWLEGNDPSKPITEYRMNVHLFGNGPSPAVATYGLRRMAVDGEEKYAEEAKNFIYICCNFYVDDGLALLPTTQGAIDLVKGAQATLATAKLRLHKVVSNSAKVMEAFPAEDQAKDVRDLGLRSDTLPVQQSLRVFWDLETDAFTFKVSLPEKPFTRRGVLSIVNSVYYPLGFAVPVMLEGSNVEYGRHIEFVNLNPGLSQMSSFHVQKHGRCKAKGRPAEDTELLCKVSVIVCSKEI